MSSSKPKFLSRSARQGPSHGSPRLSAPLLVTDPDTDAAADSAPAPGTYDGPWHRDRLALVATAALCLPFLVGFVVALRTDWTPASDLAVIHLRIRDVGSADTPLIGPFSRFGWNHPGPLLFWLLTPVTRLLGGGGNATFAAAAVQNAAVMVGISALAHRLGGRRLLLLLGVALALLCSALGGDVLISTWNPWISLLPFVALVLLSWGLHRGDLVLLPWTALAASYLVQSHVGYGAVVGALVAWGLLGLATSWWAERRDTPGAWAAGRGRVATWVGGTAAASVVLWSGPILDQLTRPPGNARKIASYFASGDGEPIGLSPALTVISRSLSPLAPWAGGEEPLTIIATLQTTSAVWALPALVVFAGSVVAAARTHDRLALQLQGTVAVAALAGALALTRITGEPFFYIVRWWWVIALFVWASALFAIMRALPAKDTDRLHRPSGLAAMGVIVVVSLLTSTQMGDPFEITTHTAAVEAVTPDVVAALEPGGTYVLQPAGFSWFESLFGLANQLDAAGFDIVAGRAFEAQLGPGRVVAARDRPAGVIVVASERAVEDLLADPNAELLAEYDPLAPAERSELDRLHAEQVARVTAAGRLDLVERLDAGGLDFLASVEPTIDSVAAARMTELRVAGARLGVFLLPPPPTAG